MRLKFSIILTGFLYPALIIAQGVPVITETSPDEPQGGRASAQGSKSENAERKTTLDTGAQKRGTPQRPLTFAGKLFQGHLRYVDNDHQGALTNYEEAKDMEPANAEGYYFIACAQAKIGRIDDALVTLKTVATLAGGKNDALEAKALFVTALLEERRGNLERARKAWESYLQFASSRRNLVTFSATANERLKQYRAKEEREEQYSAVRKRIEKAD